MARVNWYLRLVTVRKVTGNPLWVSVSTNHDEIYKSSWAALELNAAAAAAFTTERGFIEVRGTTTFLLIKKSSYPCPGPVAAELVRAARGKKVLRGFVV